ncbi:MAG: rod shape-determining protein MreC [Lentisphaeria bacterium]|nr:rod shape-determining protein MreC [Lentisphaeria bacterium]
MQENNDKRPLLFHFGAVFLLVLLLFTVYHAVRPGLKRFASDFFYPYLRLSRQTVNTLSNHALLSFSKLELAARLEQLQKLHEATTLQAAAAAELLRENQELRRYAGLKAPVNWKYITAEVMLRDPLLWQEHFSISKGSDDGLEAGDAVIDVSESGIPVLVGVLGSCGKHNSEVMTVYNPDFCFSAGIGPERIIGFVNAGGRQGNRDNIPVGYLNSADIPQVGSAVFTTGFEKRIPAGIKIGELSKVEESHPLFSSTNRISGLIRPSFNPNRLRFVIIARRSGSREEI